MPADAASRAPLPKGVPQPGETIAGAYRVQRVIGVGGMGAVVAARRLSDGQRVAVKVMLEKERKYDDSTKRFFREARAVGALESPHVAKLLDFGRLPNGLPFMVLELLEGCPLHIIIRDKAPVSIAEGVDYILQACAGVAAAHARGIIHRDLKPSNLFLTTAADGTAVVKVLDFGISKTTLAIDPRADGTSLTETGTTLGSPQYMSPEQLRSSRDVDARTDIWSLGLILHKLLSGRAPFEATTVGEHFAMIIADPPTPLRRHRPEAPIGLEEAILMCLKKDLDERWQDVAQLAEAIAPFGAAGSRARAAHIAEILSWAGASAPSLPRVSKPPQPPEEVPTVVEGSSRRSAEPLLEEHATTSAWSPSIRSFPPAAPPRRRRAVIVAAVLVVAASAFAAGRIMQDTAPETASRAASAATGTARVVASQQAAADGASAGATAVGAASAATSSRQSERKRVWLTALADGSIGEADLKALAALCELEADQDCRRKAEAALRERAAGKRAASRRAAAGRRRGAATKSGGSKPHVKVKGPLEDKL